MICISVPLAMLNVVCIFVAEHFDQFQIFS